MSIRLSEILEAKSGIERVMGDVLRVLTLYMGTLWLWEIYQELKGFRRTLKEPEPSFGEVSLAVSKLAEEGFVLTERRVRASLRGEGVEDVLVMLNLSKDELSLLHLDERLRLYQSIRREVFGI